MHFPNDIYVLAALGAGIVTWLVLPLWRKWCLRTGLVDDPGYRKIHDQPIALAGGLAVMTGMVIPILIAAMVLAWQGAHPKPGTPAEVAHAVSPESTRPATNAYLLQYGFSKREFELAGIFFGAVGMLAVGWLDDKRELRPQAKFAGQVLVAALVAACGVRITLFVQSFVFSYAITILWILTIVNAFNFMDNMNGLCAGLGAIGAGCFAVIAATHGQYLVASIAFLAAGALLGFLPYNFPKARAFLGDAGSHLVGYLLAVLAILPHFYTASHPRRWAVLTPLVVLAVPLFDLVWVVILRWRIGQPFYQGDNNHLSHRLVRRGWTRTQAVALIWLMALFTGATAFLL